MVVVVDVGRIEGSEGIKVEHWNGGEGERGRGGKEGEGDAGEGILIYVGSVGGEADSKKGIAVNK